MDESRAEPSVSLRTKELRKTAVGSAALTSGFFQRARPPTPGQGELWRCGVLSVHCVALRSETKEERREKRIRKEKRREINDAIANIIKRVVLGG